MKVTRLAHAAESMPDTNDRRRDIRTLLLAVCLLLCSVTTYAATKTSTTTGGVWSTGATWVGGVAPVAGDDVIIANGATVTVTATPAAPVNSITVGQGTSGILNFNTAAAGVTVTTTTTIAAGGQLINSTVATATRSFGTLIVNGVWNNSASSPVTIPGDITVNTGATFTSGTGLYTLSGATQAIGGTTASLAISNITLSGTVTNNCTNLTVGTGLAGAGSFVMGAGATLTYAPTTAIGVTTLNATTNTPNTIVYSSATTAIVRSMTYSNLTSSTTGIATVAAGGITVSGNLSVTSGTLSDGGNQITGNANGSVTMTGTANLQIGVGGATTETFPTLFPAANVSLAVTTTVTYNSTGAQSVAPVTYGNLTFTGAAAKTLTGNTVVAGALNTASTLTFAGYQLAVAGNFTNTGTLSAATTGSELVMNGGAAATLNVGTLPAGGQIYNLTINKTAGITVTQLTNAITVTNIFTLTSGNFTQAAAVTATAGLSINTGSTFATAGFALTSSASTTVSGTLAINGTGAKALGSVTINSGGAINNTVAATSITATGLNIAAGGTWSVTAVTPVTINGDLTNAGTFTNTGAIAYTLAGNITNDGTFTSGTGVYTLTGAGKTISTTTGASLAINSVTINSTGTYTVSPGYVSPAIFSIPTALIISAAANTLTVNGYMTTPSVTFTTGGTLTNNDTVAITTTLAGGSGTFVNAATGTLYFGGASIGSGLTISSTGNTVVYNGGLAQTIRSSINYYNLVVAKTTGTVASLNATTIVRNNIAVLSGTFSDGGFQLTGNATGTFSVAAGATMQYGVAGATTTNIPTLYTTANVSLSPTSTVIYNTTSAVTISAVPASYGHLTLSSASIKTAGGAHIIQGNLTINAGSLADAGNIITVNGNILNSGSHTGSGKIYLTGGSATHALTTGGTGTYANLELNDGMGATVTGNATITNTLTLTSGTFAVGTGVLTFSGAAIAGTGSNLTTTTGTSLVFSTTATGLYIPSSVSDLAALTVAIGTTNTLTTNSDITLNNAAVCLTLTSGLTNIGSYNLTLTGTLSGTGSATNCILADAAAGGQVLKIFPAATNTTFTFPIADNTGTLEYSPVAFTSFNPTGGTKTIGVNVTDAAHPQVNSNQAQTNYISRYWTFSESGPATSYTYTTMALTYLAADDIGTVSTANDQINRYDGSWSIINSTVTTTSATSTTPNSNVSGPLGGNDYTVRLNAASVYTWNNTAGGLWTTPGNWTPTRTTPASSDVLIFDGSVTPGAITVTAVPTQTVAQLQVINGVDVSLQAGAAATVLTTGFSASSNVLTVDATSALRLTSTNTFSMAFPALASLSTTIAGTMSLNTNNTLSFTNLLAANNTITGAITNNGGTVTSTTATTAFGAGSFYTHNMNAGALPGANWNATSTLTVSSVTTTNPTGISGTFGNFIWNNPSQTAVTAINGALVIAGDLTLTAGNINFGALNVSVAGSLTNNGTINTTTTGATLTMNGTNPSTISGSGIWTTGTTGRLLNLVINNAAGVTLTPTLTLQTSLTLTSGALNASALTIGIPATPFTLTRAAGSLTTVPTFNYTTGAYAITYSGTSTTYTVLNELPPATTPTNGILTVSPATAVVILDKDASIGTLTTTVAGATFDLNGKTLSLTLAAPTSNTGTITANASTSTIRLSGAVAQTLATNIGTYTGSLIANLIIDNSNASGVALTTQSATVGFGNVTINSSRLFNLATFAIRIAGLYTNNGTITANGAGASITLNGTSPQTFNIGTYTSSALSNFVVNNASGVTLSAPLNVSTVFTLTNGILTTSNTNLLTITATPTTSLVGGTTANYVNGPLARTLPASLVSGSTYTFPVGKSGYNLFELINPTTSSAGTIVVKVESQDAASGGTDGPGFNGAAAARYWQTTLSGAGAFTSSGTVRLYDGTVSMTTDKIIGNAATPTGVYNTIGNAAINTPLTGNILSASTALNTLGCFEIGDKGCLSGAYTIGATGADFSSLNRAIATINTSYVCSDLLFELTATYTGTETFPLSVNAPLYTGGPWNITFRPAAGVTAVTSGNPGSAVNFIALNGADYITFDGRAGGTGSTAAWTIRNTQTAATYTPTFQFTNDASNDTLEYMQIESQNALSSSGTVYIGVANATGNDNILIDHNIIRDRSDATGYPLNAIYATGTALKMNDNITISNNRIFNFWAANAATNGINIQTNNSDYTISGNSIYQTASRTQTAAAAHSAITINSTVGNNFAVTGNYIGGTAASAGGTAWTVGGAFANTFTGINMSVGSTTASSVQDNTITNMNWSCTGTSATYPGIFGGIYVTNGAVNIGDIAGNTIGAATGTGAITITNGTAGGTACGIFNNSGNGAINISGNTVGSITLQGTSASITSSFAGLIFAGGLTSASTKVVSGNTIGSTTTANSINLSTSSTPATAQSLTGILYTAGSGGALQLQNNVVANLNNNGTGTVGTTGGIIIPVIPNATTISGNSVYNLSTTSANAGTGTGSSVIGISLISSVTGHTIANNTVYNLANTNASAAVVATGIVFAPTVGTATAAWNANLVHSLTASSASASVYGLNLAAGVNTVTNNMVRLGINAAGTDITSNQTIYGIYDPGSTNNTYFNSVYIGGAGVTSGAALTYAYYGTASSGTRAIQDNIFWNERTGGSSKHYAIRIGAITGLTSNYNDLLSSTVLGQTGATDYAAISNWRAQSGTPDIASISGDPKFINRTGNAAAVDLHISPSVPTQIEGTGIAIAAVSADYDGQVRASYTPTDMGADADDFIAIDLTAPVISPLSIGSACNGQNTYTVSGISITDASGVDVSSTNKPRLYYKKSTSANTLGGWSYVQTTSASSPFSFDIDLTALGGVAPGDVVQYFVVAEDLAPAGNVAISNSNTFTTAPGSVVLGSSAFPIGGTLQTFTILPCQGTVSVGTGQTYAGITPAGGIFQTINSLPTGLTGDLTISITSDIAIEDGTNSLTNAKLNGYKVRIVPSAATLRTISNASALSVPMIPFNGAIGVAIDGSVGGTGRFLKFRNTHTTASSGQAVIQYYGGATTDSLENTIVESNSANGVSGAVMVGTGTNTGIVISGNIITSATAGTTGNPANGIYSNVATNSFCIVSGNNIENATNAAIQLGASNGNSWIISQNNIYQSVTSTVLQSGINIMGGNSYVIRGNKIGGAAAGGSGTWVNTGNVTVNGISVAIPTTGTTTVVDSNIIQNFSMTGTGAATFNGILATTGSYSIGTTYGNTVSNVATAGTGFTSGLAINASGTPTSINENTVWGLSNSNAAATTVRGIYQAGTSTSTTVTKNNVYNLTGSNNASSTVMGIEMSGAGVVSNNMVRLGYNTAGAAITNTSIISGIQKDIAVNASFYHNSVYIGGTGVGSTANNTYAFRRTSNGVDDIKDNIFINARGNATTGGIHYAFVLNSLTTLTSNYNIFNAPNTGGALFSLNTGTTAINTLQAWNVNSSNLDINSGVGDANFVSPVSAIPDLHIASPSPAEGAGTLVASITDDIDGDNRASNTPVDIGADAANVSAADIYRPVITVSGLTSLSTACGGGVSATVTATITDAGGGATTAALWYRRSFPSATTWSYFTGSLTSGTGNSGTWSFPVSIPTAVNAEIYQFYFVAGDAASNLGYQPYDATSPVHTSVTVQVTAPTSPYNVPTSLGVPLSGNVTVGSGGNYPTFNGVSGLFNAINANGLSGNLTVTVISDITETTTTPLNQITAPCGGGPYAVLIQPDGTTKRTITGAITGSVGLISYNGADSVTIDGQYAGDGQQHLHFKNTSSNYSGTGYNATFYWYNDATYNTITNTIVEGLSKAQSSGAITGGVVMLGSGSTVGNSYNTFSNNMITGTLSGAGADASTCLLFSQGSAGAPNANNQILNNSFKDFSTWSSQMVDNFYGATNNRCYGVHVNATGNGSNWTITGNSFYTTFPENHGTFTALSFQPGAASTGNTISGNYIGGSAPQCGMGTGAFKMMGSTYNYSSGGLIGYTETRYEGITVNAGAATINNNSIKRIWIRNLYYSGFVGIDIQGSTSATVNGNVFGGTYPSAYTDNFNTVGTDIIEVDGGGGNSGGASGYIYGIWVQNTAALNADSNTFNYLIQNGDGSDGGQVKCIWHQGAGFNITRNINSAVHQEAYGLLWNSYAVHIAPSLSSTGNRIDNNKFSTVMINDGNISQVRSSSIYLNVANGLTVSGTIQGNQIYDNGNIENSGYVDGIYLYGNTSGAGTWDINNNMIYLSNPSLNTRESMTGINLQLNSSFTTRTYYNTVWIAGSSNTNTGVSNHCFAFFRSPVTGTDVCTVKNNIFINTRTGGNTATYFGAIANNTSATGWTSDYNFLMDNSGSSRNIIGYFNGTAYTRFSGATPNWQATTGQDANGRSATYSATVTNFATTTLKPSDLFANTAIGDMHIAYTNGTSAYQFVDARATPLSITVDYDGDNRDPATPDIGADEFNTCSRIAITAQPAQQTACAGATVRFGVKNTGATPYIYQWQVSADHGATWLPLTIAAPYAINGAGDTLTIAGLTAGLDSLLYRVDVFNLCGDSVSAAALIHVNPAPHITWETPASHLNNVCTGSITQYGVKGQYASGFQWQVSTDAGATWSSISGGGPYNITQYSDTSYLSITTQASLNNNLYRCIASNSCGQDTSADGTLLVQSPPVDTLQPGTVSICAGSSGTLSTAGTGVSAWAWQYKNGTTWTAVTNGTPAGVTYTGSNTASLQVSTSAGTAGGYYLYRSQLSSLCGTTYSDTARLNVMNGSSNAYLATVSDSLLVETCPDGGWTYYSTYSQPDKWLFAIKKNGNTLDATPTLTMHFTAPVGYDSVENPTAQKALFTMNRHWNVTIHSGSIDSNTSPVSVRFFYDPADTLAMMNAARAWALAHPATTSGMTTAVHSVEWFKTRGIQYAPGNNTVSAIPTAYTFAQAAYSYGVLNGVNYVELKNITSFSGGTAAIRVAPTAGAPLALPVKLLYLTATPVEDKYIRLDWATASEVDNKGFYLERSTDGVTFAPIAWVDGHGNSNATLQYTRPDHDVTPDVVYYYRLRQVDYDEHYTYSEMVSASIKGAGIIIGEPVPNPASDATRISVYSSDDQAADITMYNATGQLIHTIQQHIYQGANYVEIAVSDLASGIYFVNINIADQHTTRRVTVR